MRLLIALAIVSAATLCLFFVMRRRRRSANEYVEADLLAIARSITSLPHQQTNADRE